MHSFEYGPERIDDATAVIRRASDMMNAVWLMDARFWDPGALAKLKVGSWLLGMANRDDVILGVDTDGNPTQSIPLMHLSKRNVEHPGTLVKVYGPEHLDRVVVDVSPFGMPVYTFHRDGRISKIIGEKDKKLGFWASRILSDRLAPVYPL